jgi:hypothetical protein
VLRECVCGGGGGAAVSRFRVQCQRGGTRWNNVLLRRAVLCAIRASPQVSTALVRQSGLSTLATRFAWPVGQTMDVAEAVFEVVFNSNYKNGGLNVAR